MTKSPRQGHEAGSRSDGAEARSYPGDDPGALARFKEFPLTSFALRHRTSAVVTLAIIGIMGVGAYGAIPKESSPDITIPYIAVNTIYSGAAPNDVESLVTRVIEEKLNTIADIKELRSTSVEGYSSITAEFSTGVDIKDALQKVREKVDLARPDLPGDAEDPSIVEFNFADWPIMQVNISGSYSPVLLKEVAEDLKERLEQIPEILEVSLSGGLEREVKVDVDLARLQFYGLALADVVDAIRNENVNIPGGSIDVGPVKYLVRVDGEFADPDVIEDIVVVTRDGRPVYVRDIAQVDFGFKERDTYARLDGIPVVTLGVSKRSGENIIATSDAVKAAIAELQPTFPPSTVVKVTSDQSEDIHTMVSSLENNIISGLILIVAVLLFFLGVRTSFFVALAIPTSMLLSFVVLHAWGITMNMVVLFSLILALGMLVDNAIVVVENIYRYMEQGWPRHVAAAKATGEVAMPVIAATATTVGAFLPLVFWPGIAGEFMGYLPRTLIVTLSSSLFVALVIIPVLCALFMRLEGEPPRPLTAASRWTLFGAVGLILLGVAAANWLTALLLVATAGALFLLHTRVLSRVGAWFQRRGLPALVDAYERRLRWALDHRMVVLGATGGIFVGTIFAFGAFNSGVEYFPESIPPKMIWVDIDAPTGTGAAFTSSVAARIEAGLKSVPGVEDDVESVVTTVGGSGGDMFTGGGPGGTNTARVTVAMVDFEDRRHDAFDIMRRMEDALGRGIAGADVNVTKQQDGPPSGKPVNLEIVGEDPAVLERLAARAVDILESSPVGARLQGLENDMDRSRPELRVVVDRETAALYGLNTMEVGSAVRAAIQGVEAAKYRTADKEYDIVVRLAEPYRSDLTSLQDLTVVKDGRQVPLLSVASWEVERGAGAVQRKDLDRVATVSSEVAAGLNSNAVLAEVQEALAGFGEALPPGYTIRFTGQSEDQAEAEAFLSRAFLIALILIGFILISQFNSVIKPVIILTSVVMSTVGVLVGLMVFRMPFGIIMTGVGVISLAGIVVNNAIVLIDYIDILRDRDGMNRREALVQGGRTRLRPVVLTAMTTALGLMPLAIGLNFDFFGLYRELNPELYWGGEQAAWWGPMAIAVIVGILFATFLTLVLVPVMYSLVDDVSAFFRRHYASGDARPPGKGGSASGYETDGGPGRIPAGASPAAPARSPGAREEEVAVFNSVLGVGIIPT